jgi:hypothetical protein
MLLTMSTACQSLAGAFVAYRAAEYISFSLGWYGVAPIGLTPVTGLSLSLHLCLSLCLSAFQPRVPSSARVVCLIQVGIDAERDSNVCVSFASWEMCAWCNI